MIRAVFKNKYFQFLSVVLIFAWGYGLIFAMALFFLAAMVIIICGILNNIGLAGRVKVSGS